MPSYSLYDTCYFNHMYSSITFMIFATCEVNCNSRVFKLTKPIIFFFYSFSSASILLYSYDASTKKNNIKIRSLSIMNLNFDYTML